MEWQCQHERNRLPGNENHHSATSGERGATCAFASILPPKASHCRAMALLGRCQTQLSRKRHTSAESNDAEKRQQAQFTCASEMLSVRSSSPRLSASE